MTSSSDAGWRPFAAFVPSLVPGGMAFAPAPAETIESKPGSNDWLPPLRTRPELDALAAERDREERAYSRGADEATRAERSQAEARCATALQAVAGAAAHLAGIAEEFARDRERDVQAIAIAAARHIVQHELALDPLRVAELVRRAVELLPTDHTLEIRLHPDDLATLRSGLEAMAPPGRNLHLSWLADADLERGGFVIETPHRIVDGRADVALRALYERLDHD
jgi:flagellar biosynthesis/type III secretory pathway protein FliH